MSPLNFDHARRAIENPEPDAPPKDAPVRNYKLAGAMMRKALETPERESSEIVAEVLAENSTATAKQPNVAIHRQPAQTDFLDALDDEKKAKKQAA